MLIPWRVVTMIPYRSFVRKAGGYFRAPVESHPLEKAGGDRPSIEPRHLLGVS